VVMPWLEHYHVRWPCSPSANKEGRSVELALFYPSLSWSGSTPRGCGVR
jgi:hypothetical protein